MPHTKANTESLTLRERNEIVKALRVTGEKQGKP